MPQHCPGEGSGLTQLCWHSWRMGVHGPLCNAPAPAWMRPKNPHTSQDPPSPPSPAPTLGCSGTAPGPWCIGKGRLHLHTHPTTATPASGIQGDIPSLQPPQSWGPGARGQSQPQTLLCPVGFLLEAQRASQPPARCHRGPSRACSMHTAHREQRAGERRAEAREDRWTLQGPNRAWVPLMHHQPAGDQQDGHPRLTPCPLEGQSLLQGEVGGRGDGEWAGSSPTPTDARQAGLGCPQNQNHCISA